MRPLYNDTPPAEDMQTIQLQTDDLASGTYLLWVQSNGATTTRKISVVQ